jgi:hypothetical protein
MVEVGVQKWPKKLIFFQQKINKLKIFNYKSSIKKNN